MATPHNQAEKGEIAKNGIDAGGIHFAQNSLQSIFLQMRSW